MMWMETFRKHTAVWGELTKISPGPRPGIRVPMRGATQGAGRAALNPLVKHRRITYKYMTYVLPRTFQGTLEMDPQAKKITDPNSFLPLSPRDFQVLMVVFDEPMHGYGIVKLTTEELGREILDLGSLYRIIGRLTREGLIEDVTEDREDSKRQRRYYRATQLGRQVTRAEAARLRELLASDRADLLWEKP